MCVVLLGETLSEKVAEVAENNEYEVADVCRDQNVVRRFFYLVFRDGFVRVVLRDATIALVGAMAELGVNGVENLFRGRGGARIREARAVVVTLVKNGVL